MVSLVSHMHWIKQDNGKVKTKLLSSASDSFSTMVLYNSIYLLTNLLTYLAVQNPWKQSDGWGEV